MNGIQVNVPSNGKPKEPTPVKIVSIDISTSDLLTLVLRLVLVLGGVSALFCVLFYLVMALLKA